jgi:hypothetical protein
MNQGHRPVTGCMPAQEGGNGLGCHPRQVASPMDIPLPPARPHECARSVLSIVSPNFDSVQSANSIFAKYHQTYHLYA